MDDRHGLLQRSGTAFQLACSCVGTAIMLFPYLKKQNESIALGYVCFRLLEAVIIVAGTVAMLSLVTLSREAANGVEPNAYEMTLATWLIVKGFNSSALVARSPDKDALRSKG
ncbi:MAG TPA: DUF4386 domain-containing protein [Mycetocola sp.]|nr:DUF4386 domain-containing protein [Mycetocola sp.]